MAIIFKIFKRSQKSVDELIDEGANLVLQGSFMSALYCFDEAIKRDPKSTKALSNKASILGSLGRFEEAIIVCDKAIEVDPKNANAWYSKGNCLDKLNRIEEELSCYEKALEIDPNFFQAMSNKAYCLNKLGHFKEAIECCDAAIKISSSSEDKEMIYKNKATFENNLKRSKRSAHKDSFHYINEYADFSFELPTSWHMDKINPIPTFWGSDEPRGCIQITIGAVLPKFVSPNARKRFLAEPGAHVIDGQLRDEKNVVILIKDDHTEISAVRDGLHYTICYSNNPESETAIERLKESIHFSPPNNARRLIEAETDNYEWQTLWKSMKKSSSPQNMAIVLRKALTR